MANERFKVKFGLAVGDTVATVDGTTGNIVTTGDIAVNGGDVTTTAATTSLFNTNATTLNMGGAATTVSIGANTGTTTINNSLVADDISVTTVDTTNLEVTNIKAKDGTAAMTIANTTGVVSVNTLVVNGNTTLGSDTADEVSVLANNITFGFNDTATPRGILGQMSNGAVDYWFIGGAETGGVSNDGYAMIATGDDGNDEIYVRQYTGNPLSGTVNRELTLLDASGNTVLPGTLDVQGGTITDSTGALSITTGASNGAITLDPNGTGNVAVTFANGGNLTNDRNYVHGAIRNATTRDTNGDIWELNTSAAQGATNPYFRGLSLDNSADTTRGPATLMRSYSGGAVSGSAQRGRVIFEKARGTAASPTAVTSGDILGGMDATGYSSTGWLNDTVAAIPATSFFTAAESWVSNTNLGSTYGISLAPTATTISSGANLIPVLSVNPQTSASRSDAFTWANGKTGTTQTMALDVSGNLTVTGDVRINGNNIQNSAGLASIDLSSANTLTTIRANTALFQTAANVDYASINATGSEFTCTGITNFVRTGTVNGIQPPFKAQYKNTTNTDSTNGDGAQILLSTAGSVTQNNIARFDATYITGGNHQFGIAVSSDNFSTVTNSTYKASRDKTEILATPSGGGTSTVIMEVTDAKILNNRAHRNAITTGTVARGGTYSVPATANGSIELTITAGSGTTHIDVDAVASDAATGGMYSILIYNNSGDNNIDVQVRNNGVNIGVASNLDIGDRAIASVYVVGEYAACEIMDAA